MADPDPDPTPFRQSGDQPPDVTPVTVGGRHRAPPPLWISAPLLAVGSFRTVVTLLNDTGERYGSTGMWERSRATASVSKEVAAR